MSHDQASQQRRCCVAGEDQSGGRTVEGDLFAGIDDLEHAVAGEERHEPHDSFGGEHADEVLDDEPPDQNAGDSSGALTSDAVKPTVVAAFAATTMLRRGWAAKVWVMVRDSASAVWIKIPLTAANTAVNTAEKPKTFETVTTSSVTKRATAKAAKPPTSTVSRQ